MNRLTFLAAAVVITTSCNSGSSNGVLTSLTKVTADATCPAGGVKISTGKDTNGDGTLQADEATQNNQVCNGVAGTNGTSGTSGTSGDAGAAGSAGASALISTVMLQPGDAACPNGGSALSFGLDDGAGGGTAGNGVLETGEVRTTQNVCNGATPYYPANVTPPAGPAGTSVISANGGDHDGTSPSSNAGRGGSVDVFLSSGTNGGAVKVFATGSADAGFTIPTLAFNAGALPLTIAISATVPHFNVIAQAVAADAGFFQLACGAELHAVNPDGGRPLIYTSLSVAAQAVLKIEPGCGRVALTVPNGIRNDGTITAVRPQGSRDGVSLYVNAGTYSSSPSAALLSNGLMGETPDGGATDIGGNAGDLHLRARGDIVLQGVVSAAGGSGTSAGHGSQIYISSDYGQCFSTGLIDSHGGSSSAGQGNRGYYLTYSCPSISNAAELNSSGGNGATSAGNAFPIDVLANFGSLVNSGKVSARGGDCATRSFSAGAGSSILLSSSNGRLVSNAPIDASGGRGGAGGSGGAIAVRTSSYGGAFRAGAGSVSLSGSISANGGLGSQTGGNPGSVSIYLEPSTNSRGESVELLGYEELRANGGGSMSGQAGRGGDVSLFNRVTSLPSDERGPGGPTVNTSKLSARAGDGFYASRGGSVSLRTQNDQSYDQSNEFVSNSGTIDVIGGASPNESSGYGGNVELEGIDGVTNSGRIIANGSAAGGFSGGGGGGEILLFSSAGRSTNSGALSANGGTGNQYGGPGGYVSVDAAVGVNNSGAITATGGNAMVNGGAGGTVVINLSSTSPAMSTGSVSVAGGTGTNPGRPGTVTVDRKDITP